MSERWHRKWIGQAIYVAEKFSKDSSTKVAAIIIDPADQTIVSQGYNGFPRGVDESPLIRHTRPSKYLWTEHAERNAIYLSHRANLRGCWLYLNWNPILGICADCARAIIQTGIVRVIGPEHVTFTGNAEQHKFSLDVARTMFLEAGVKLEVVAI